jgi:hypothetical protein
MQMESIIQAVGKYYERAQPRRDVVHPEWLDESTFRAIGFHKLMAPVLPYSENGMWRKSCPRAAYL